MDQDLWMKALQLHGSTMIQQVIDNKSEEDVTAISRVIAEKYRMLFQPPDSNLPTSNVSSHSVPIEMFQNLTPLERRNQFFKSLNRGDILTLQVINETLPNDYKLLVLFKHMSCMKLDDLSLVMFLPKLEASGDAFVNGDMIRAAVCSCMLHERKLYVTLDSHFVDSEKNSGIELGKVSKDELPFYVGKSKFPATYVDYLHTDPSNKWASIPNQKLYSVLGYEKNCHYSFFEEWDAKQYSHNEYGRYLRKKNNIYSSNILFVKAQSSQEANNIDKALEYLNDALLICPTNKEALFTRGKLWLENKVDIHKAFHDMNGVLKLDPSFVPARKIMAEVLVSLSKSHLEKKNIPKALECLQTAMELDKDNKVAASQYEKLQTVTLDSSSSVSSELSRSSSKSKKKSKKHRSHKSSSHERHSRSSSRH